MVLDLLLIGLAITLEPIPLTAFVLVLSSNGSVRKGAAFIFGWLLSLAVVVALTLLVTGNNPPEAQHRSDVGGAGRRDRYRSRLGDHRLTPVATHE
ncbi:MAG: GAP family protein [Acidimicrobiales bacterium]